MSDDCRAAFEAEYLKYNRVADFTHREDMPRYVWQSIQEKWEFWQAAWNTRQPESINAKMREALNSIANTLCDTAQYLDDDLVKHAFRVAEEALAAEREK